MLRVVLGDDGETLTATCDAADSHRLVREAQAGVLALFCTATNTAPDAVQRTRDELGDEEHAPQRHVEWAAPGGARLALDAHGIASGHGVHGEDATVRASGLPVGVELAASWSIHHRRGGSVHVTARGCPGLAELARRLQR